MRRLFLSLVLGGQLLVTGLANYELAAKLPGWLERPWPGWRAAVRAECTTPWREHTGWHRLDRVLHESEEAVRFYCDLLG
jgi:hypothetical protein